MPQPGEWPPRYRQWDGQGSLVGFVVSLNLHRRHLTASQRAMIGADMLPLLEEEARKRQGQRTDLTSGKEFPEVAEPERARDQAAAIVGVNPHYVSDAKRLQATAPELADDVRSGEITIPQARALERERAVGTGEAWGRGGQDFLG
jgi:hypothetical protein